MFKIFEGETIEDLESEVNDWLIHSGVRVVNWNIIQALGMAYVMTVEYSWMQRQQDDQQTG